MSRRRNRQIPPEFIQSKSSDYRSIFCTGVFGGLNPKDGQLIFYLDRIEPELAREQPGALRLNRINREFQIEIHMTPTEFKSLARLLRERVQQYEEIYGEIPMTPRKEGEEDAPSGLIT